MLQKIHTASVHKKKNNENNELIYLLHPYDKRGERGLIIKEVE